MKQKCKRLFTLLLAVALLVTGLPAIEAKAAGLHEDAVCSLYPGYDHFYHNTGSYVSDKFYGIYYKYSDGSKNDSWNIYEPYIVNPSGSYSMPDRAWYYAVPDGTDEWGHPKTKYIRCAGDHGAEKLHENATCTIHSKNEHFYNNGVGDNQNWLYGISYTNDGREYTDSSLNKATRFADNTGLGTNTAPTNNWYYLDKETNKYKICTGEHGIPASLSPSTSKKEAPAEPLTPAEEIRAAEEEAFPLTTVETDKTGVTKEEVGLIPDKTYNLSAYATTRGFVSALEKIVKANPKEKTVSIFTGKAFTFNKGIVEAINKGGKEVVYYFNHAGHLYSITVPATVDAAKVLEKGGHAGPLYVGKVLGTTRLIK